MAKVNKAFSIDPETFLMLDRYCAASETWDKRRSRSAVVNEAIRWYLQGDNADMITESHRDLMARYRDKCIEVEEVEGKLAASREKITHMAGRLGEYSREISNRSWWKRLLGLN
tara:strand:- start:39 stop:380 length:342 start_codon:yes stop_codon:yes gene_type:complete